MGSGYNHHTRVHGTRTFTVEVHPRGPLWKRHLEQLRPRYGVVEDADPGIVIGEQSTSADRIPDHPKAETLSPPTSLPLQRKHPTIPCLSMEDITLGGHHARGRLDSCVMPNEHF